MELVMALVVALGLLVALWPWLLVGGLALVVGYLIWTACRRRRKRMGLT